MEFKDNEMLEELEIEETVLEEEGLPPHYNVSLVQKDGKYAFFDNDENIFITFKCENAPDGMISTMAVCEPLMAPVCREDQYDEMDGETAQLGWRYKLTENGDWGWISEDCSCVCAPEYQEIEVHCDGHNYQREDMRILARDLMGISCGNGWNSLQRIFSTIMDELPEEKFSYEDDFEWHLLTWNNQTAGRLIYKTEEQTGRFKVAFEDGILSVWEGRAPKQRWMCAALTLENCEKCFTFRSEGAADIFSMSAIYLKKAEYQEFCLLFEAEPEAWGGKQMYYGVRRSDRYWGVVKTNETGAVSGPCTPFAFTHIRVLNRERGLAAVEQFGKWGVYDIPNDKYITPCDYESVAFDRWNECVEVCRMNFKGQVNCDGTWRKHLHREEG